jgi:tRNA (cytidine/uridine-2'-O-)-methyltransferase
MVHCAGHEWGGMFDVILYQPEIPPNTGNIIRLCANTGVRLHLVKPLGFSMDDRQMRRAGLDYHEFATVTIHDDWTTCMTKFQGQRVFAVSTKGTQRYDMNRYMTDDVFVFGPETRGLPEEVLKQFSDERCIRIPMVAESRSLNLSNAVAVLVYEAMRQLNFGGDR